MPNTGSGRKSTSTDHRLQTEKPMCSEKIEKKRLRRATFLPVDSQNRGSSGRQSSIHLPGRRNGGAATVFGVVVRVGRGGAGIGRRGRLSVFPRAPLRWNRVSVSSPPNTPPGEGPTPRGQPGPPAD